MSDFSRPTDCSCIPGIKCDVKDCVHNDKACHCTAESITVACEHADDAACDTYRRRAEPCALHGIILHHIAAKNQVRFCNIFSLLM